MRWARATAKKTCNGVAGRESEGALVEVMAVARVEDSGSNKLSTRGATAGVGVEACEYDSGLLAFSDGLVELSKVLDLILCVMKVFLQDRLQAAHARNV